ncbi:MAG: signal peptidase I, partial [Firmicutes bacterium]|nr:signal peptidase I [Bacillota bacterium]
MTGEMKRSNKAGSGGRLAGVVIAISIVLLAAVMPAVVSKVIPAYENTFLGWRPLVVRTNSMESAIRKNAIVIVYAAQWDTLKVNDVITFRRADGRLDTHRVIAKDGAHVTTKGDNAAAPDTGWVTPDNYKYKVFFIWNWTAWLSEHRAAAYLICLPPLLILLVAAAALMVRRAGRRGAPR